MKFVRGRRCVNNIEFPFPPLAFPNCDVTRIRPTKLRRIYWITFPYSVNAWNVVVCIVGELSWSGPRRLRSEIVTNLTANPRNIYIYILRRVVTIGRISYFRRHQHGQRRSPRLNVGRRRGSFCCNLFRGYAILVTLQHSKSTTTNLLKPACGWWWFL